MDLISAISSSLGVDERTAQGAVGSVLGFIRESAPSDAFAAVSEKVPEASDWMALAPAPGGTGVGVGGLGEILGGGGGGGGGLGDILGGVVSSLGLGRDSAGGAQSGGGGGAAQGGGGGLLGGLAGLASVLASLSKLGLNAESLGKLLPLVLQFLQSRLGQRQSAQLISSVPALSKLAGGDPTRPTPESSLPPIDGTGGLK
jgi:hypothetical protein